MDNHDAESGAASVDLSMEQGDMVSGFVADETQTPKLRCSNYPHVGLVLCCGVSLQVHLFCPDPSQAPLSPILLFLFSNPLSHAIGHCFSNTSVSD